MLDGDVMTSVDVRHAIDMKTNEMKSAIGKLEERMERLENRLEITLNILSGIVDLSNVEELKND